MSQDFRQSVDLSTPFKYLKVKVGEVWSFDYTDKTGNETNRLVRITNIGHGYVDTLDLVKQQPRRFDAWNTSNAVCWGESNLKVYHKTDPEIVKAISNLGVTVSKIETFPSFGVIGVWETSTKPVIKVVNVGPTGFCVEFTNMKNKVLKWETNNQDMYVDGCRVDTVEGFIDALYNHHHS